MHIEEHDIAYLMLYDTPPQKLVLHLTFNGNSKWYHTILGDNGVH